MEQIEKKISSLVEQQFPDFYRTDGPLFVEFVKKYYQWLETSWPAANTTVEFHGNITINAGNSTVIGSFTNFDDFFEPNSQIAVYSDDTKSNYDIYTVSSVTNSTFLTLANTPNISYANVPYATVAEQKNALYWNRRLLDNQDVDLCDEEILIYFKEKYLKNIKIDTVVNTRRLIKHSLDLYRSKGTERSIDLLYKAVFGKPAEVYHPSKDVFTTSSAEWYVPRYLELSLNDNNKSLVGKQVTGVTSNATAFVDSVVRKIINGRIFDIAYISAINGNFIHGEKIKDNVLTIEQSPTMIGSLNDVSIDVRGSGNDFKVGDFVDISSYNGTGARGRVIETINTAGIIDYVLTHGGFGYTNAAEVLVSDRVLTVKVSTTNPNGYFETLTELVQPVANIEFENANGTFFTGSNVYTYHANNDLKGVGQILDSVQFTPNSGYIVVSILSGNIEATNVYSESNTVGAEQTVFTDQTITANVVAYSSNVVLSLSNVSVANLQLGRSITQEETQATGIIRSVFYTNDAKTNADVTISNVGGVFFANTVVSDNISGYVDAVTVSVGVIAGNVEYTLLSNNYIYGVNTVGTILDEHVGTANVSITSMNNMETIFIGTDIIGDYEDVALDDVAYGFPAMPSGNAADPMEDLLSFDTHDLYSIESIAVSFADSNVLKHPIAVIYDPITVQFAEPSYVILDITAIAGNFVVGEQVQQFATNALGQIVESNSTHLVLQRLRYDPLKQFTITSNNSTIISGLNTGASANVNGYEFISNNYFGKDAVVNSRFLESQGAVTKVEVTISGFGFLQNEEVVLTKENISAFGFANLHGHGIGEGYYKDRNGFLSNTKYLYDGIYYQPFSYEVRSSIINKDKAELAKITHVAGTKYFDKIVYNAEVTTPPSITVEKSIIND